MKVQLPLLAGLLICLLSQAAEPSPADMRLVGIVALGKQVLAIIDTARPVHRYLLIRANEKQFNIQVIAIDAARGRVIVFDSDANQRITLRTTLVTAPNTPQKLSLHNIRVDTALALLQQLQRTTVLPSESLPFATFDLHVSSATSDADAIERLMDAIRSSGVALVPSGKSFLFAVPSREAENFSFPPPPPGPAPADKPREQIPEGMIRFQSTAVSQVNEFYSDLSGHTIVTSGTCQSIKISVLNATTVTRPQAVWMLEALYYLRGLAVVREGDAIAVIVPFSMTNALPRLVPPAADASREEEPVSPVPALNSPEPYAFLSAYCAAVGLRPGSVIPGINLRCLTFNARRRLTRVETKYALEVLALLHGVALERTSDGAVNLLPHP